VPASVKLEHSDAVESAPPTELAGNSVGGAALGALDGTVVAADQHSDRYLIWRHQRLRVADSGALAPLGLTDPTPRIVGASWLNTVPVGPDLAFPQISGRGSPGPTVAGHALLVGQLVVVRSTVQTQYAVVLADGLAPVTPIVAARWPRNSCRGSRRFAKGWR